LTEEEKNERGSKLRVEEEKEKNLNRGKYKD